MGGDEGERKWEGGKESVEGTILKTKHLHILIQESLGKLRGKV